jgi:hypothetical protein
MIKRRFIGMQAIEKQERLSRNYEERLAKAKELNKKAKEDLFFMNSRVTDTYNHPNFRENFKGKVLDKHMQGLLRTDVFKNPALYERIIKKRINNPELGKVLVERFKDHSLVDKAFKAAKTPSEVRELLKNPKIRSAIESIDPNFLMDEVGLRTHLKEMDIDAGCEWDMFIMNLRDKRGK